MIVRSIAARAVLGLPLLFAVAGATNDARADATAANGCAAKLPKDAKAIFDATLPQLGSGAVLRDLVTTNTRSLAMAGTISRGNARPSAEAAAKCLQLAGN